MTQMVTFPALAAFFVKEGAVMGGFKYNGAR